MTTNPNQKLSISIPTYNRADFLNHSLATHIPLARKHNLQIFITDNASTDHTPLIVSKWISEYPFIRYSKNKNNLGPDANFEIALKAATTEYVWLLGDTYSIDEDALSLVLKELDNSYDHIIVNVGNEVRDIPSQVYNNQNKLLSELFWLMTCLSVHIYRKNLINGAAFHRYRNSSFIQTGIVFEFIDGKDFRVSWIGSCSVNRINFVNKRPKETWMADFFEIWIRRRLNIVFSLPPGYDFNAKLAAVRQDGASRSGLTLKQIISLRAKGLLSLSTALNHKNYIKIIAPGFKYFSVFLISLIPVSFFSIAKTLRTSFGVKNM